MEISKIQAASGICLTDQCHIWRSKFIDKASKCETELKRLSANQQDAKLHFKGMAEKILAKNEAGKTKADKNEFLIRLLEELIPLIELRAEIAHSQLLSVSATSAELAMFQNANCMHTHFDKLTVLSAEQRKRAYDRLSSIAGQLAQIK